MQSKENCDELPRFPVPVRLSTSVPVYSAFPCVTMDERLAVLLERAKSSTEVPDPLCSSALEGITIAVFSSDWFSLLLWVITLVYVVE